MIYTSLYEINNRKLKVKLKEIKIKKSKFYLGQVNSCVEGWGVFFNEQITETDLLRVLPLIEQEYKTKNIFLYTKHFNIDIICKKDIIFLIVKVSSKTVYKPSEDDVSVLIEGMKTILKEMNVKYDSLVCFQSKSDISKYIESRKPKPYINKRLKNIVEID